MPADASRANLSVRERHARTAAVARGRLGDDNAVNISAEQCHARRPAQRHPRTIRPRRAPRAAGRNGLARQPEPLAMPRLVTVNDRMQQGYRYMLTAPAGQDFDPAFRPELTPQEMLRLGVFGGKYMTDCRSEFGKLVPRREASGRSAEPGVELLRRRCEPAAVGVARQGLDPSGRPPRLVSVVLPLLPRPPHGRRRAPDRALGGDASPYPPGQEALRARRPSVPAPSAPSATALGL